MMNPLIDSKLKRVLSLVVNEPIRGSGLSICFGSKSEANALWIPVVYTPDEFTEMSQSNYFVHWEIKDKEREVYHVA